MCNLLAMTYLQQEDFGMVLELLKKAEILTERDPAGRAVTFNNLACYYRRQGKLHAALQYLQKALNIEASIGDTSYNPADTHLNACAVLSQMGRHQSALEHAQNALIILQEELFQDSAFSGEEQARTVKADRIAVLAIAYHNVGVEQEFLKRFERAMNAYRKGVTICQKYLGEDHAICVTLKNSLVAARRAISMKDRDSLRRSDKKHKQKQRKRIAKKQQRKEQEEGREEEPSFLAETKDSFMDETTAMPTSSSEVLDQEEMERMLAELAVGNEPPSPSLNSLISPRPVEEEG